MAFLGSAEVQEPLIKPGKLSKEKVIRGQLKLIQECPWKPNATAVRQYRKELGQCCNASERLVVTKENTPLGSIINLDGDIYSNITVDAELRSVLLKRFPLADTRYSKCAVVGNGGILHGSNCGQLIDQANFVIRFNLPPLSRTKDVGSKTHLVTINPSILSKRFKDLLGHETDFINALWAYPNALFLIPAISFNYHLKVGYRAIRIMKDVGLAHKAFFIHPHYLSALDKYWKLKRMRELRLSTGFMFTSFALEFCDDITLYGFWPFFYDLNGKPISHHYYDNVLPLPFVHNMSEEFSHYLKMSSQGVLHLHLGKCQ
ncbi:alpha-2,8-sialyltransferase 8F-like [Thamnophis elegans]|uniref:alpha-2,8-sialyltransferase 8F-like n=1 Tax=Thamnophis elegans TaxID=35005 RepID=UPI0013775932|nr:alpha-2,8-sialyltransferase 8F-like [Thamnophis elegans]